MAGTWVQFLFLLSMAVSLVDASVPAIFVFGDSTADVGNNNFLANSSARADFPHNGVDFPFSRPTGRFSNGFNSADLLAKLFGLRRSPPAFLSLPTASYHRKYFRGVNFASGGSGILDITGNYLFREVISNRVQIQYFKMVYNNLTAVKGSDATKEMLSKSLFLFSTGSNDLLQDFFLNGPSNSTHKANLIDTLMSEYEDQLSSLYNLGARKFGIISIPPIGCCPFLRTITDAGDCLGDLNESALEFYSAADSLLCGLSSKLEGMKYSHGNAYEMALNVIQHPHQFGFQNVTGACCGGGKLNAQQPCTPAASLCSDRRKYLFWDVYHPTQKAAKLAAATLYGGPPRFVQPINFQQLAEED